MNVISHEYLAKLRKLKLKSNIKSSGIHKGIRRSYRFGSSLEFSDFRTYQPGDDIRQIDWNVYSRTRRHYIKRYLDEQEMNVAIYLDCTSSMRALPEKWMLAKSIAASLSFVCLENEDRLSFFPISAKDTNSINRKGAIHGKGTVFQIMKLDIPNRTTSFVEELERSIQKGKQITILISDGMESPEKYEGILRKLALLQKQIVFIQVLSKDEVSPSFHGDAKLIDSELETEVNISMSSKILEAYEERLEEHNQKLKQLCRETGAIYALVTDNKSVDEIMLKEFVSSGILQY